MAKLDPKKWPQLKKDWDAYGHSIPFEQLDGIKSDRGCYCVVRWKNEDGSVELSDLARGGEDQPWEMQNDGFDPITEADWRKLRIVPECDWFEIPGNPNFKGLA